MGVMNSTLYFSIRKNKKLIERQKIFFLTVAEMEKGIPPSNNLIIKLDQEKDKTFKPYRCIHYLRWASNWEHRKLK